LDQLDKAAEAALRVDSPFQPIREAVEDGGLENDLRSHYLEIKQRAQKHLDSHIDPPERWPAAV
jgi:hypothetical protein